MLSLTYRHSIALLCCALPLAGVAQSSSVTRLDQVVVTPGRTAQLESEVIGDVTVVDKEELQRSGQTSVAEILARQPGVQFDNNGGPQTQTAVRLRGTNASQTLVLIDGVRVNDSIQGSINWNTIDPATIERIEIVRGAASSLYGSDAIGGVINIITSPDGQDRPFSAWANFGYGTHETVKSSAGLSGAAKGWDYNFSVASAKSDGFNATNHHYPFGVDEDNDGYRSHSVSGALGYHFNADHALRLTAYNSYVKADYDAGSFTPDARALTRQQAYTLTSTNRLHERWLSTLRFGLSKDRYDDRAFGTIFSSLQRRYTWQNDLELTEDQSLTLLLERLEERPTHSDGYPVNRRDTNSAAAIYRAEFGRHHVQASVRHDNITGYKKKTTGGLGYQFDIDQQWAVVLNANTGFRMPTLTDLYSPWAPNPDVQPETSKNIEAGLKYRSTDTDFSLTLYQNKLRDLIALDPAHNYAAYNIGRATIRGLTLAGTHRMGNTTLSASADFLHPRDDDTRHWLPRRARQVYNLGLQHRIERWELGAEYQFTGKRYDDADNTQRLAAYSLLNLTAAYDINANLGVQVRWNNVLNKKYTNAWGYNMPRSNVFVNLSWRM